MAFFKQSSVAYQPENRAVETLVTTVKHLVGTLNALQQTPAYQGAFGAANPALLRHGLATLNQLLVDLDRSQVDSKESFPILPLSRLTG